MEEIVVQCGAAVHLERCKAVKELERLFPKEQPRSSVPDVEAMILCRCGNPSWEVRLGAFSAAAVYLRGTCRENKSFSDQIFEQTKIHLLDDEGRTRYAVVDALVALVEANGSEVFDSLLPTLIKILEENFSKARDADEIDRASRAFRSDEIGTSTGAAHSPGHGSPRSSPTGRDEFDGDMVNRRLSPGIRHSPGASPPVSPRSAVAIRQDTEAWKLLETTFLCMQRLILACGSLIITKSVPFRDNQGCIEDFISQAVFHSNRFVRESSQILLDSICKISPTIGVLPFRDHISQWLARGMSDEWNQVRFAASHATRALMALCVTDSDKERVLPELLPPMVLNRHIVAEGVRLYAQETWTTTFQDRGKEFVAKYIDKVVEYYIHEVTSGSNHTIREAACACIAELGSKVSKEVVEPYANRLMDTIVTLLSDPVWSVRDAACSSAGAFLVSYPKETTARWDVFWPLLQNQLFDTIWSARECGAIAIGKLLETMPDLVWPCAKLLLETHLEDAIYLQTPDTESPTDSKFVTRFGVPMRRLCPQDMLAHHHSSNGEVDSHEAPCRRETEPWEKSDGCVYLLRELSVSRPASELKVYVDKLIGLTRATHFQQSYILLETIWICLPVLASRIGGKEFAPRLLTLESSFQRDLRSNNRLVAKAARDSFIGLRKPCGRTDCYQLLVESLAPFLDSK